jgi:20S proteasome alpha/beta subunit
MTVAIGMVAEDGLVLAADTQETIAGYWKVHSGKIRALRSASGSAAGAMLVSAAGDAVYCDALMQRLTAASPDALRGDVDMEARCAEVIHEFHTAYVTPYHVDPPHVQTLIAMQAPSRNMLAVTDRSVIVRHDQFASIGIGGLHAHGLLNQLWHWQGLSVVTMSVVAAYVIFQVKERVDGCGKWTEVGFLRGGQFHFLTRTEVTELEDIFREYLGGLEPDLFRFLANAAMTPTVGEISRRIRAMRRQTLDIVMRIHNRTTEEGHMSSRPTP